MSRPNWPDRSFHVQVWTLLAELLHDKGTELIFRVNEENRIIGTLRERTPNREGLYPVIQKVLVNFKEHFLEPLPLMSMIDWDEKTQQVQQIIPIKYLTVSARLQARGKPGPTHMTSAHPWTNRRAKEVLKMYDGNIEQAKEIFRQAGIPWPKKIRKRRKYTKTKNAIGYKNAEEVMANDPTYREIAKYLREE